MSKVFEDYFSEYQADMVSICLEYVSDKAEKIYIYCSSENGITSSDFFYRIEGKIVERHQLNEVGNWQYDVSVERQNMVLKIINNDLKKMVALCSDHGREMPTEMKLIFDVQSNHFEATYSYESVYSNDPTKFTDDMANEWFEEIKKMA